MVSLWVAKQQLEKKQHHLLCVLMLSIWAQQNTPNTPPVSPRVRATVFAGKKVALPHRGWGNLLQNLVIYQRASQVMQVPLICQTHDPDMRLETVLTLPLGLAMSKQ